MPRPTHYRFAISWREHTRTRGIDQHLDYAHIITADTLDDIRRLRAQALHSPTRWTGDYATDIDISTITGPGVPPPPEPSPTSVKTGIAHIRQALAQVHGPLAQGLGRSTARAATTAVRQTPPQDVACARSLDRVASPVSESPGHVGSVSTVSAT